MSDIAIRCEGLSKRYQLGQRENYRALRDTITETLTAPARYARRLFASRADAEAEAAAQTLWALKDVSFDIKHGEVVGIIGRNGAGKSTLLKILSRITQPTSGDIYLNGRVGSLLEVGTGFHAELTGRENIFLSGAILGMKRTEITRKFDEIVAFAEIEKFLDTPVKRYSSGMYVRLAFAVAAHLEPEILVVDEVLAVGDAQFQKKCLGKMNEVSKEGRTVLFVSHNMGTIMQLCKSCLLLDKGQLAARGKPSAIVEKYYDQAKTHAYHKDTSEADIFLKQIFTCDAAGHAQSNFAHHEDLHIRLTIGVNKFSAKQNIGLCLLRQDKKRVFTVNKKLDSFYRTGATEIEVDFTIAGGLIAPMEYSFLCALNTEKGLVTFDWQEDVCPIKIYDDGTELAFAEGTDYGCIILRGEWAVIRN